MDLKYWKRKGQASARQKKKSAAREWGDAVMFAVVVATLVRWSTFEAFAIPSSSMEKSLLTGDFLFVSKLHYGARTPITPVQVPLTHQTLWGTQIPSFSEVIRLPYFRLPGFSGVRRQDAVVFNHPEESARPLDLKTYLVKRCIGVAGDTLAIRGRQVYLNGKAAENPENLQFRYFVRTDRALDPKFFHKRDITDVTAAQGGYDVHALPAKAALLASLDFVQEVNLLEALPGEAEPGIFPHAPEKYAWNKDHYGPVYIPKAGASVAITPQTLPLYEKVIRVYEGNDRVEVKQGKLYLDGKQVSRYTFRQNYYFMMGDNRHNSNDSRYWGFVPETYVVGKAAFVWMSADSAAAFPRNIRWSRLFQPVE